MEMPLLELTTGKSAVIKRISEDARLRRRLAALDIRIGQIARRVGSGPFNGPVVIEVNRAVVAVGKGLARQVFVEELQE